MGKVRGGVIGGNEKVEVGFPETGVSQESIYLFSFFKENTKSKHL